MYSILEEYKRKLHDDPIPLMQVMGNEILMEKFHGSAGEVYAYCIEHNVKWAEVLEYEFEPGVIY